MPGKRNASLRCPICRKIVLASDPEFPFCGERCRLIDLGAWLSEKHAIPGAASETGEDSSPSADATREP